jgi:hypothetical protein
MTENDWRDAPTNPTGREKTEILWAAFQERLASRLLALCFGPFYLLLCAIGWSTAAKVSPEVSLFLTGVSAVVIMVVITLLAEKFHLYRRTGVRFSLSTAFMMTIPFCIYLAAIQKVLQRAPTEGDPVIWLIMGVITIGWMGLTTVILIWLAEALMYLAVWLQRWWLVRFRSGSRPSEGSMVDGSQSASRENPDAVFAKPMIRDDAWMGGSDATSPFKPTE